MAMKRLTGWIRQKPEGGMQPNGKPGSSHPRRVGEVLLSLDAIDEQQLRLGLELQRESGGFIGEILVSEGFVSASVVGRVLSDLMGFPFSEISFDAIDHTVATRVDEDFARRKRAIPIREDDTGILVAMSDPLDIAAIDELRTRLHKPINPTLAFPYDIEQAVENVFTVQSKSQSIIESLSDQVGRDALDNNELLSQAGEGPIVRLVQNIIEGASRQGASDIHIEPREVNVRVRYRVDGILYEQMTLPRSSAPAVVSRIKIISHLNIAERRRPQDGRFLVKNESGATYDVRVSIVSTVYGEKVVLRLLEKNSSVSTVDRLGFFPEQQELFEKFIKRPHGVILVTGPTGSGKSTTMFAGLSRISSPKINISSIEDPVEYHLPGANQINVNQRIGVTFASGLRTLVRQDPDVIMVGEIRDGETAEIAIQAALTGHLVLSTLHTNNAAGAIVRLQNMGIEPFLITSAVIGVIGQRLLRTVCPSCREWYPANDTWIKEFNLGTANGGTLRLARGRGCVRCNNRGMKGRTAVCEVMPINDSLRNLVLKRANASDVTEQARADGMMTLRQAGVRLMLEGVTTPEEVLRVLYAEEDE
jgi:type IV pilus assembly protein PilB